MSAPRSLRVVVADDEPLARQRLEDLLARSPGVEIAGTASDGDEAVRVIRDLEPDLVFLDIQMPGRTGLDVVVSIGAERMPATIFTTAWDQYAVRAFEMAAIDYLVKPFDDERFAEALGRARRRIELAEVEKTAEKLVSLLQGIQEATASEDESSATDGGEPRWLERIAVESRGQVRVVPVEKIDYITASGPYAELHVGERAFAIREQMQALEERLDPALFLRIHRSVIVRLDRIEVMLRREGGDYAVRLRGGAELPVSRGRREALERKMGIASSRA